MQMLLQIHTWSTADSTFKHTHMPSSFPYLPGILTIPHWGCGHVPLLLNRDLMRPQLASPRPRTKVPRSMPQPSRPLSPRPKTGLKAKAMTKQPCYWMAWKVSYIVPGVRHWRLASWLLKWTRKDACQCHETLNIFSWRQVPVCHFLNE